MRNPSPLMNFSISSISYSSDSLFPKQQRKKKEKKTTLVLKCMEMEQQAIEVRFSSEATEAPDERQRMGRREADARVGTVRRRRVRERERKKNREKGRKGTMARAKIFALYMPRVGSGRPKEKTGDPRPDPWYPVLLGQNHGLAQTSLGLLIRDGLDQFLMAPSGPRFF